MIRSPRLMFLTVCSLLAASLLAPPGRSQEADPLGHWEGAIEIPGQELVIQVDLSRDEGAYSGTIDIPIQGARGLPLEGIEIDGARVRFAIRGVPGEPTFEGQLAEGAITGSFSQAGATFPFRLGRDVIERVPKPQEPQGELPYQQEEVTFRHGEVVLAGTLTVPRGEGPFPAAVLVSGSGAQDRDESLLGHKPFLVLADHLTRAGIAVLRYDDRGVGGSSGSTGESTTEDFAGDALAAVELLRGDERIAADRVGIVGHSEGGLVGPLAASRSPAVAFVVMLAGPGVPGAEVLELQSVRIAEAGGADADAISRQRETLHELLPLLRSEAPSEELLERVLPLFRKQLDAAPEAAALSAEDRALAAERNAEAMLSPWFRYFLFYDPRPALRQVKVPVLALFGGLDLQVVAEQNAPEVEKALREGGNEDVTVRTLDGLNHLFQHATTGSPAEYAAIEETFSPEALEVVSTWINERFGAR